MEEGESVTYTISVSGGVSTEPIKFKFPISHDTTEAEDFFTIFPSDDFELVLAAGAASSEFHIKTKDDDLLEGDESFTVTISNPTGGGGTVTLGTASVTTTITDNESAPAAPTYTCEASTYDADGDCLIEVSTARQLAALSIDIDETGVIAHDGQSNDGAQEYRDAFGITDADVTTIYCGSSVACKGYELSGNIALTDGWSPLGSVDGAGGYKAVFNDNGHTISGLSIPPVVAADTTGCSRQ